MWIFQHKDNLLLYLQNPPSKQQKKSSLFSSKIHFTFCSLKGGRRSTVTSVINYRCTLPLGGDLLLPLSLLINPFTGSCRACPGNGRSNSRGFGLDSGITTSLSVGRSSWSATGAQQDSCCLLLKGEEVLCTSSVWHGEAAYVAKWENATCFLSALTWLSRVVNCCQTCGFWGTAGKGEVASCPMLGNILLAMI